MVTELQRGLSGPCDVEAGAGIVLGVSGGADSIALLLGCVALRDRARSGGSGLAPIAVHVHHHLRGADADGDAAFVGDVCRKYGIDLRMEHVAPAAERGNIAENARILRYEALAGAAESVGAGHVAVAHHADDQFETMLIALCRGAGADGLSGMAWNRPLTGKVALIRPLLGVRRVDCEDLCRAADIAWRDDASSAAGDATICATCPGRSLPPVFGGRRWTSTRS